MIFESRKTKKRKSKRRSEQHSTPRQAPPKLLSLDKPDTVAAVGGSQHTPAPPIDQDRQIVASAGKITDQETPGVHKGYFEWTEAGNLDGRSNLRIPGAADDMEPSISGWRQIWDQ